MFDGRLAGLRFQPPVLAAPAELRWVLLRAFGPSSPEAWPNLDGMKALAIARRLGVSARIGGRGAAGALATEVGDEVSALFAEDYHQAAAKMARVAGMAQLLADIAAAERLPILFLKFAALHLRGDVALGTRRAADVDVLVPEESVAAFQRALERRGFFLPSTRVKFCQLPAVYRGVTVEVHSRVLRLCSPSQTTPATLEELRVAGVLENRPELPGECYVPVREMLVAYAIAHGVDQNALRPWRYPLLRMVADLIDLRFSPSEQANFLAAGYQWISDVVSVTEVVAAVELAEDLARGRVAELVEGDPERPASVLLRHIVASAFDPGYVDSLRLSALFRRPPGAKRLWFLPRKLVHALFLSRSEMDRRYGTRSNRLGYLVLRVWRPVDLVVRFLLHVRMYLAYRIRVRRAGGAWPCTRRNGRRQSVSVQGRPIP